MAKVSRRIFQAKTKGFTLIELLISIAIIAFVVAIGIPKLGRSLGTQLRATVRKVLTINKELHHFARLKNKTYRLVLDFGDADHQPSIYVESATGAQLMATPDSTPLPSEKDLKKRKGPFDSDTDVLKKPVILPRGVKFEDVEIEGYEKPFTDGKAYIHFFPQGLVQKSIIHITDGQKIHWSLIINPLTGHTFVRDEYLKLRDYQ